MRAPIIVDTHCHLDFERFDNDRAEVVERAYAQGVLRLVNPGIDVASSRVAVTLAEQYDMVYAAVGVHPNTTWNANSLQEIRSLALHPKVVAIGEIGMDYYREHTMPADQKITFRTQLDLAAELDLPVIVHCRNAHVDALEVVSHWQRANGGHTQGAGVFHSYSGNAEQANETLAAGFYLGFTGPVTFPKAVELRQIASSVPLDRILVETDAPFLAPQQQRGKRNEPAYVRWVVERIAAERALDMDEFSAATSQNAARLFNWTEAW